MRAIKRIDAHTAGAMGASANMSDVGTVVEELVFNSLDARASYIHISLKLSDWSLRVEDNGHGISAEDMGLVGEAGATSKTGAGEGERGGSSSYGFRGCTLSHLSRLATVRVLSRPPAGVEAAPVLLKELHPGGAALVTPVLAGVHAPPGPGTVVVVQDLFSVVPVRQRALKQRVERDRVLQAVSHVALVHPAVVFVVVDEDSGTEVLSLPRCTSTLGRLAGCFGSGRVLHLALTHVTHASPCGKYRISGYVGFGHHSKELQLVYVDGRYARRIPALSAVIEGAAGGAQYTGGAEGTAGRAEKGSQRGDAAARDARPAHLAYLLDIHAAPGALDVVRQPDQTLIHVSDEGALRTMVRQAVRAALGLPSTECDGQRDAGAQPALSARGEALAAEAGEGRGGVPSPCPDMDHLRTASELLTTTPTSAAVAAPAAAAGLNSWQWEKHPGGAPLECPTPGLLAGTSSEPHTAAGTEPQQRGQHGGHHQEWCADCHPHLYGGECQTSTALCSVDGRGEEAGGWWPDEDATRTAAVRGTALLHDDGLDDILFLPSPAKGVPVYSSGGAVGQHGGLNLADALSACTPASGAGRGGGGASAVAMKYVEGDSLVGLQPTPSAGGGAASSDPSTHASGHPPLSRAGPGLSSAVQWQQAVNAHLKSGARRHVPLYGGMALRISGGKPGLGPAVWRPTAGEGGRTSDEVEAGTERSLGASGTARPPSPLSVPLTSAYFAPPPTQSGEGQSSSAAQPSAHQSKRQRHAAGGAPGTMDLVEAMHDGIVGVEQGDARGGGECHPPRASAGVLPFADTYLPKVGAAASEPGMARNARKQYGSTSDWTSVDYVQRLRVLQAGMGVDGQSNARRHSAGGGDAEAPFRLPLSLLAQVGQPVSRAQLLHAAASPSCLVGQLDTKFLLLTLPLHPPTGQGTLTLTQLVIVDQHAVDERARLEALEACMFGAGVVDVLGAGAAGGGGVVGTAPADRPVGLVPSAPPYARLPHAVSVSEDGLTVSLLPLTGTDDPVLVGMRAARAHGAVGGWGVTTLAPRVLMDATPHERHVMRTCRGLLDAWGFRFTVEEWRGGEREGGEGTRHSPPPGQGGAISPLPPRAAASSTPGVTLQDRLTHHSRSGASSMSMAAGSTRIRAPPSGARSAGLPGTPALLPSSSSAAQPRGQTSTTTLGRVYVTHLPRLWDVVLTLEDLRDFVTRLGELQHQGGSAETLLREGDGAPAQSSEEDAHFRAAEQRGALYRSSVRPPAVARILNSKACRGAIMFGDVLDRAQATDLLRRLALCKLPFQCAHGRPAMVPLVTIAGQNCM